MTMASTIDKAELKTPDHRLRAVARAGFTAGAGLS
jgi:hypothetical protein